MRNSKKNAAESSSKGMSVESILPSGFDEKTNAYGKKLMPR